MGEGLNGSRLAEAENGVSSGDALKDDLHIAEKHDPLKNGDEVETLCGEKFVVATIQPLAENEWVPGSKSDSTEPRGICRRCLETTVFRYLVSDRETQIQD